MSEQQPPQAPPTTPGPVAQDQSGASSRNEALRKYNFVADKVGGVMSIRLKDNLLQLAAIGVFTFLGAGIGWFMDSGSNFGLMAGAFIGLVAGVLTSGFVLMIIGLVRKS